MMGESSGDRNTGYYSISHFSSLLPGYLLSSPDDCSTRAGFSSSDCPLVETQIPQLITCPNMDVPAKAMPDSHDCESDVEGAGGMEPCMKTRGSSSSGSKRSRAADVHNLSEKRRRCRINEKMRALQNLIPNSTMIQDKASMLDEVIDYLKQQQLKIQMLSKKHGINFLTDDISGTSSKPVHSPHLQKLLGRFPDGGAPARTGMGMVPVIQDYLTRSSLGAPNQYNTAHQSLILNYTNSGERVGRFGFEPSLAQHESFHVPSISEELNRTNMFQNQQMNPRLTGRTDGPFQMP